MRTSHIDKVKRFYFKNRRLPTVREMQKLFNFSSTNGVAYYVQKWIKEGLMITDGNKLTPAESFFAIPILGSIKAGHPAMEQEYQTDTMLFGTEHLKNPNAIFLLKVSGDSMINAGIYDGDWVLVDKNKEPRDGDIVAANIDLEWTLKYFNKSKGKVFLTAANPKYPTFYPKSYLMIGGVVVKSIREYT